jgi:hypothetical protein
MATTLLFPNAMSHSSDKNVKEFFESFEIMDVLSPNRTIVRRQSEVNHAWVDDTVWMGQGSTRNDRCRAVSNLSGHGPWFLEMFCRNHSN